MTSASPVSPYQSVHACVWPVLVNVLRARQIILVNMPMAGHVMLVNVLVAGNMMLLKALLH